MSGLPEIISMLESRPGMYLRDQTLAEMIAFLSGYITGLNKDEGKTAASEYNEFNDWVRNKYNVSDSHGCESIIRYDSANERDALVHFFKLWNEFGASRKQ